MAAEEWQGWKTVNQNRQAYSLPAIVYHGKYGNDMIYRINTTKRIDLSDLQPSRADRIKY